MVFIFCQGSYVGAHQQRILMNFFCYVHQHGCHGLCHLSPTGLKVTWVKTVYTTLLDETMYNFFEVEEYQKLEKSRKLKLFWNRFVFPRCLLEPFDSPTIKIEWNYAPLIILEQTDLNHTNQCNLTVSPLHNVIAAASSEDNSSAKVLTICNKTTKTKHNVCHMDLV